MGVVNISEGIGPDEVLLSFPGTQDPQHEWLFRHHVWLFRTTAPKGQRDLFIEYARKDLAKHMELSAAEAAVVKAAEEWWKEPSLLSIGTLNNAVLALRDTRAKGAAR